MVSSDLGEDARSRQFLTFYQREMALYTRSNADRPVEDYCLDHDLHPIFKAGCCPVNCLITLRERQWAQQQGSSAGWP